MNVQKAAETQGSTGSVLQLSKQIIATLESIQPSAMDSFADLNVTAASIVNLTLQPMAKQSLKRAIAKVGRQLRIASAYRTVAQQYLLRYWFEHAMNGIPLAAQPGQSNHEDGLALDISRDTAFPRWKAALVAEGWVWQGAKDPSHFSYRGGGTDPNLGKMGVMAFQVLWNQHNPDDKIAEDGDFGPQTRKRLKKSPAEGF